MAIERSERTRTDGRHGFRLGLALGLATLVTASGPVRAEAPATPRADKPKPGSAQAADLVEQEQPVACDGKAAGKLLAAMAERGFAELGLLYLRRYHELCGPHLRPHLAETLANREALLHFQRDDDDACLQALAGSVGHNATTEWNRALCGGPCTLEAGKCAAVADARKAALAARALRAKRRPLTRALCQECKPTEPCAAEQHSPSGNTTLALAWDLKSAQEVVDGVAGAAFSLHYAGDINGDGLGDVVVVTRRRVQLSEYLYGRAFWDGTRKDRAIPALTFKVLLGCGARNEWKTVWRQDTARAPYSPSVGADEPGDRLDEFDLRVEQKPGSDIPSVCIYKGGPTCAFCSNAPMRCLDLSAWRKIAAQP